MKERILVTAVALLVMGGMAQAQDTDLHGYVDVTWSGKYVWRGFDIYGDKSAVHPSLDLNLFGTGLGVNVTGHRANSGGFENGERWDYNLYYLNSLLEGNIQYRLGWVYYNYPDQSSGLADLQEVHAILSLPKICPFGTVPSYVLVKLWPSESGSMVGSRSPAGGTASGFAHIFMLDYAWTVGGILPDTPEQVLNLHAEAIYNDGVGPNGANVDHDWSNAVFGVSTNIDLAQNVVLTPGIYHQVTMDKSVNPDKDETWVSMGLKYQF
ncbi:MAG: hypothetical protein AAB403_11700 [Planctomycetota bacterium]